MIEPLKDLVGRFFPEGRLTRWIYPETIPDELGEWYSIQMIDTIHIHRKDDMPPGYFGDSFEDYENIPFPVLIIWSKKPTRSANGTQWPDDNHPPESCLCDFCKSKDWTSKVESHVSGKIYFVCDDCRIADEE